MFYTLPLRGPILALIFALSFVGVSVAHELPTGLMEKVSPSVGALYKMEDGGNMSFLCSVTAVGKDGGSTVLLTAYHCVNKGVSYRVTFDGKTWHQARVWKIPGYEVDDKKYRRNFSDPEVDMAMFLVDGIDAPIVPLAQNSKMPVGSEFVNIGFPLGIAKIHYRGSIAGVYDRQGADQDGYVLLQAFGAPGSSGSSIIDAQTGEIKSVLVSGRGGRAGLPVIFATPINYRTYLKPVPTRQQKSVGGKDKGKEATP